MMRIYVILCTNFVQLCYVFVKFYPNFYSKTPKTYISSKTNPKYQYLSIQRNKIKIYFTEKKIY